MKLKRKLMSKVIEDLKDRGAKVTVIVEPIDRQLLPGQESLYRLNWVIEAKWPTGRHWRIDTIIEEIK